MTTSGKVDSFDSAQVEGVMLETRHLVKRYFGVAAVDDVNLSVRPGEVVGYLGPNGSAVAMTMSADDGAAWIPSFWFLGLQETLAGDAIGCGAKRIMQLEDEATALYRDIRPRLAELAGFLWNTRKLPAPMMTRRSARGAASRGGRARTGRYTRRRGSLPDVIRPRARASCSRCACCRGAHRIACLR
jgi:hypothetical protein